MKNHAEQVSMRPKIEGIVLSVLATGVAVTVASVLLFIYKPDQNALGALASVCMDVISIAVLLILLLSLAFESYENSKTTRLFLTLILATVIGLFFDFLTWSSDGDLAFGGWTYVFTVSSLIMGSILAAIFVMYLSSYMDDLYGIKKAYKVARICAIMNLISFMMTFTLAIGHMAFTFVDGHYETGALYELVTAIPILTLMVMTGYAMWNYKIIGRNDVIAVSGYIITMISGALIETQYRIGATYVAVAVADVFIFVMLQNKVLGRIKKQKELLDKKVNSQHEILESMADIIDEEKKNVELWMQKSNTDELTGFLNRHAYEDEISLLKNEEIKENFVYVSIDVNGLKVVNDTLGHEAGDELLLGAAKCLKQSFGAYGNLYRTGGDEFVALIYADDSQLLEIKKDVIEITENWEGRLNDSLTMSFGYVTRKEADKLTLHQIAVMADKRMYEDKTRYYQKKGIDRRGQRDAHVALCALYTKILKINITEDTYQIIDMDVEEKTKEKGFDDRISVWLSEFGKAGYVHPEDLEGYLAKTNLNYMSSYFKSGKAALSVFYRRKYNESFRKVMLEIIPANDYQDEMQTLFLYVKDIDDRE